MFIARLQIKNKTRIWMGNINLSKRRQALLLEFHNFLSNVLVSAIFLKEQVTYLETLLKHSIVEKTYTISTSHFYLDEKSTFVVVIKVTCFFCFFVVVVVVVVLPIRVFFTETDDSQDSRGKEGTIFYSTLPLPPAHEH